MPARLRVRLSRCATFFVDDIEVPLRGLRGKALVLFLAVEGDAVPRATLAQLLWGDGRLSNLRQELYRLRALPGAADWLSDGPTVRIQASVERVPPVALDELDGVGTAAFQQWLDAQRLGGVAADLDTDLLQLLAIAPGVPASVVARALGVTEARLARVWSRLALVGDLVDGKVRPGLDAAIAREVPDEARRLWRRAVLAAWHDGPPEHLAEFAFAAGLVDEAAALWLRAGRATGRVACVKRAWATADAPALRAEAGGAYAQALQHSGDHSAAEQVTEQVHQQAYATQDVGALTHAAFTAALVFRGDAARCARAVDALDELTSSADAAVYAGIGRGLLALHEGTVDDALACFARATQVAGSTRANVLAENALTAAYGLAGQHGEARRRGRALLGRGRALGDLHLVAGLLNNLAASEQRCWDLASAAARLDDLLGLLGDNVSTPHALTALFNRAFVALYQGELGRVRGFAQRLVDAASREGVAPRHWQSYLLRGHVELDVGRYEEAASWFERSAQARPEDAVHQRTQAFNVALARYLAGQGSADALWPLLEAVGRRDITDAGVEEIGLHATDPSVVAVAAARLMGPPDYLPHAMVRARAGADPSPLLVALRAEVWPPLRGTLVGLRAVRDRLDADERLAVATRAKTELARLGRGLLPAQQRALAARYEDLADD